MTSLCLKDLIHWFNAIRNIPDNERYRVLEGMWDTQLYGKEWITIELNKILSNSTNMHNIYVFGGWIGILSSMLFQCSTYNINRIRSIDIDPWCENIADTICKPYEMDKWKFKAITSDMSTYKYDVNYMPSIVINTSTEHITQEIYNKWYDNIPLNTIVVIQGNNFFNCPEHIRCATDLEHFREINKANEELYSGILPNKLYHRYMSIWIKK
jgi:hypothetical protein